MTSISDIDEIGINRNLKVRYDRDQIYVSFTKQNDLADIFRYYSSDTCDSNDNQLQVQLSHKHIQFSVQFKNAVLQNVFALELVKTKNSFSNPLFQSTNMRKSFTYRGSALSTSNFVCIMEISKDGVGLLKQINFTLK